ncbi:MAG: hypothetical protein M1823_003629 [Watsoniomyces obsoletus]|nr:MAG: hypothetical protein M1823_003629 [Watsoniomyces obsoletus]
MSSGRVTLNDWTPADTISDAGISINESLPVSFDETIFPESSRAYKLPTEATTSVTPTDSLPEEEYVALPDPWVPDGGPVSHPTALLGLALPLPLPINDLNTLTIDSPVGDREPWVGVSPVGNGEPWVSLDVLNDDDVSEPTTVQKPIIIHRSRFERHCQCHSEEPGMTDHRPECYNAILYLRGKRLVAIAHVLYSDGYLLRRPGRPYGFIEPEIEYRTNNMTTGSVSSGFGPLFDCGPLQEVVLKGLHKTSPDGYVRENRRGSSNTSIDSIPWVLPENHQPAVLVEQWHPHLDEAATDDHLEAFGDRAFPTSQLQADAFRLVRSFRPQDATCARLLHKATKHALAATINARAIFFPDQGRSLRKDLRASANASHRSSDGSSRWTNSVLLSEQLKAALRTVSKTLMEEILDGMIDVANTGSQEAWPTTYCVLILLGISFEAMQSSSHVVAGRSGGDPVRASVGAHAKARTIEETFSLLMLWCDRYVKKRCEATATPHPRAGSFDAVYDQIQDTASRQLVDGLRQLIQNHDLAAKPEKNLHFSDTVQYPSRNAGQLVIELLCHYQ